MRTIVDLTLEVLAIHLHSMCQAIDIQGTEHASSTTRRVNAAVRQFVPLLEQDRQMDADVQALVNFVRPGELHKVVLADRN